MERATGLKHVPPELIKEFVGICGVKYGGRRCLDLTLRLEPFKCWMYEYLDSKPTDTKVTESLDDCTYQTGFLDRIHFRTWWLP